MVKRSIGIITGAGIGPEIMDAALSCLKEIERIRREKFDYIFYSGPAPTVNDELEEAYSSLKEFYSKVKSKGGVILRSSLYAALVYKLREDFNLLYKLIFLEPIPELLDVSPLKKEAAERIKFLLIRDNAQGLYHSEEKLEKGTNGQQIVWLTSKYEENKIEDIARVAFRLASQSRGILHLLVKGCVLHKLAKLWIEVFEAVNHEFPEVSFDWDHPDCGLADMFITPHKFDVVVALDVDADIISDFLSGLLYGTRAITPSGNFDPSSGFATYQTIHGSADVLAGQDKANPIGMIMAVAMMLELSFGMAKEADLIRNAVRNVLLQGYRTSDIFPMKSHNHKLVGTAEMKEKIVEAIQKLNQEKFKDA